MCASGIDCEAFKVGVAFLVGLIFGTINVVVYILPTMEQYFARLWRSLKRFIRGICCCIKKDFDSE